MNNKGQAAVEYVLLLLVVVSFANILVTNVKPYLVGDQGLLNQYINLDFGNSGAEFKNYTIPR